MSTSQSQSDNKSFVWNKVNLKSFIPAARDGHCCAVVDRKMYVFGGVASIKQQLAECNELLMFDFDTLSWSRLSAKGDIPSPRSAACLAAVGNFLYLFGGSTQEEGWTNTLYAFNTETSTWALVTAENGSPPSPRDKMASVSIGQNIYVFGGFGPKNSNDDEDEEDESDDELADLAQAQKAAQFGWFDDLFVFDTDSRSWSQPMQLNVSGPTPRAAHTLCATGHTLVVFGGRDPIGRQNDLYFFDTENRKWSQLNDVSGTVPEARSFHTALVFEQKLVVFGGRGVNNQHFNDFHVFDISNRKWVENKVTGDIPEARALHVASIIGDSLVVFGGSSVFNEHTMSSEKYFNDTFTMSLGELVH